MNESYFYKSNYSFFTSSAGGGERVWLFGSGCDMWGFSESQSVGLNIEVGALVLVESGHWSELCQREWTGMSRTPGGNTGWKVTAVCGWEGEWKWRRGVLIWNYPPSRPFPSPSSGYPLTLTHSSLAATTPSVSAQLWWHTARRRSGRRACVQSAAWSELWGAGWSRSDGFCSSPGPTGAAGRRRGPSAAAWRGRRW